MKSREHHPTNVDVNGWRHILTSSSFGHNSWDLCSAIALMAKKLCLKRYCRNDGSLEAFLASKFIFLDKSRGVRHRDWKKYDTAQKIKFSIKDFFSKCDQNPQFPADLVTFTEEILNGNCYFLCSVRRIYSRSLIYHNLQKKHSRKCRWLTTLCRSNERGVRQL